MGLDSPFAASASTASAMSSGAAASRHPKTRTKNDGFFANLANAAASAGSRALNALDDEKHDDVSTAASSTHDTSVGQRGGSLVGTHFVASLGGGGGAGTGGGLTAGLARIRRANSGGAIDNAKKQLAKEEAANNTNISARRFSESAAAQSAEMLVDMLNDDWSDDDDDEDMLNGNLDRSNRQYFGSSSKLATSNAFLQRQEEQFKSAVDSFRSSCSNGKYTYTPPTADDSNRPLDSVGLNNNSVIPQSSPSDRSSPVSAASSVASDRRRSRQSKSSWGKNQSIPQAPPSSSVKRGADVSRPTVPVNEVRDACSLSIDIVGSNPANINGTDDGTGTFAAQPPADATGSGFGRRRGRGSVLVVNDMQASTLKAEALQAVKDAEQAINCKDGSDDEAAKNKKKTGHLASGPLLAEIRRLLNLAYDSAPNRHVVEDFAVVPAQGDGCAICILRAAPDHTTKEFTAVWLAARLLVWSSQHGKDDAYENMLLGKDGVYDPDSPVISLRFGINSGEVRVVRDIYGDPSVVGESIDLSCRICDSARPNQILASSGSVIPKLVRSTIGNIVSGIRNLMTTRRRSSNGAGEDDDDKIFHGDNSGIRYTVDMIPNEIIVGMNQGGTSLVQSITCSVEQVKLIGSVSTGDLQQVPMEATEETPRIQVGSNAKPLTKWYMKIKPTELAEDETTGMKSKVPPTDLIQRHVSIAFVGVNHDRLAQVFSRVIDQEESLRWERVYILFLADSCIESLHAATEGDDSSVEDMIRKKNKSRIQLEAVLSGRVNDLRFYEYNQPFFCGSFWDWNDRGGFIHVSPLVWGCSPKRCPAINYIWHERLPSADYQSYRDGLNGLLKMARPFNL